MVRVRVFDLVLVLRRRVVVVIAAVLVVVVLVVVWCVSFVFAARCLLSLLMVVPIFGINFIDNYKQFRF